MDRSRADDILREWSAVASNARRPLSAPRRHVTRTALPAGLLAAAVLGLAAVLVFSLLYRGNQPVGPSPSSSATASPSTSATPIATPEPTTKGLVFRTTGSMAHARTWPGLTAVVLKSGRVFVVGGELPVESGGPAIPTAEIYDPATGEFTSTGAMKAVRYYPAVALLNDGRVLVAGGLAGPTQGKVHSAEIYDPATDSFSLTGSPVWDRQNGVAVTLQDGRVLIAGGYSSGSSLPTVRAELYDPATGKFSATGSMTVARFYGTPSATLLADGRVLFAGGGCDDGNGGLGGGIASAELYDPKTGKFGATGSMLAARYEHTATLLPDGRVLIAGGFGGDDASLDSAELYDPKTGKFSATGSMHSPRGAQTATLLPDGRVLIAGGWDFTRGPTGEVASDLLLSSAELFDPAAGSFAEAPPMTTARRGHAAVPLPDGSVLVVGGQGTEITAGEENDLASAEVAGPAGG
jgi:hypothetical protein